ncbi:hypothetical protein UNDYM_5495 [Undibacterium sp. YM2]|nr:hypothetical protein UNDYM_5495 [Undibacterium sp. YM2]
MPDSDGVAQLGGWDIRLAHHIHDQADDFLAAKGHSSQLPGLRQVGNGPSLFLRCPPIIEGAVKWGIEGYA